MEVAAGNPGQAANETINLMIMQSLAELPIQKLKRAVGIREQIEALTLELNELLGTQAFVSLDGGMSDKRRSLTPAGRARIAAAQRLRWSKYNAGRTQRTDLVAKKHRLSPEGRAKVAAAVRARWDKFRAAKAKALRAAK
jgi:hypothetical protein